MKRTDNFFSDLERQLVSAAHARAGGTLRRRPPAWLRPAVTFAVAAAAVVAAIVGVATFPTDAEREATPANPSETSPAPETGPRGDCSAPRWVGEAVPYLEGEPPAREKPSAAQALAIRRTIANADLRLTRRVPAYDADEGLVEFFAVPTGDCDTRANPASHVCFVAFLKAPGESRQACLPIEVALRGSTSMEVLPAVVANMGAVVGLAPHGVDSVSIDFGLYGGTRVDAHDGVIAQLLPVEVAEEALRDSSVSYRYFDGDSELELEDRTKGLPRVLVVDPDPGAEQATEIGQMLSPLRWAFSMSDTGGREVAPESTIEYRPGYEEDARELSNRIGIAELVERAQLPEGVDLLVTLGTDRSTSPASGADE